MNGYNFTERVRKVLAMAREEAMRLHHEYVGTEHILLGLVHEGEGVAVAVIDSLGVDRVKLVGMIEGTVKRGKPSQGQGPDLPYTSRAKKVLELGMSEARELGHSYVGTEHLLLGLIREEKGIAAQVLTSVGLTLDVARAEALRLIGTDVGSAAPSSEGPRNRGLDTSMAYQERVARRSPGPLTIDVGSVPPPAWATSRAHVVIDRARADATNRHSRQIEPEHLLIALLAEDGGLAATLMDLLGTNRATLQRAAAGAVEETLASDEPFELVIPYAKSTQTVLRHAFHVARSAGDHRVGTDHLLLGLLLEKDAPASRVLTDAGLTAEIVSEKRGQIVG